MTTRNWRFGEGSGRRWRRNEIGGGLEFSDGFSGQMERLRRKRRKAHDIER